MRIWQLSKDWEIKLAIINEAENLRCFLSGHLSLIARQHSLRLKQSLLPPTWSISSRSLSITTLATVASTPTRVTLDKSHKHHDVSRADCRCRLQTCGWRLGYYLRCFIIIFFVAYTSRSTINSGILSSILYFMIHTWSMCLEKRFRFLRCVLIDTAAWDMAFARLAAMSLQLNVPVFVKWGNRRKDASIAKTRSHCHANWDFYSRSFVGHPFFFSLPPTLQPLKALQHMPRSASSGFRQHLPMLHHRNKANCGFDLYVWLNSCKAGQSQVNTDYVSRRTYSSEAWI